MTEGEEMTEFLGILLAVVGLLLTVGGIAGVVLIGSDNTVDSPATTLGLGGAKAVVSTPGLLAFKDMTLRLCAQSSGGAVFIGWVTRSTPRAPSPAQPRMS